MDCMDHASHLLNCSVLDSLVTLVDTHGIVLCMVLITSIIGLVMHAALGRAGWLARGI